jgi:hypothetical protein
MPYPTTKGHRLRHRSSLTADNDQKSQPLKVTNCLHDDFSCLPALRYPSSWLVIKEIEAVSNREHGTLEVAAANGKVACFL